MIPSLETERMWARPVRLEDAEDAALEDKALLPAGPWTQRNCEGLGASVSDSFRSSASSPVLILRQRTPTLESVF
jgi:hypothetical protein